MWLFCCAQHSPFHQNKYACMSLNHPSKCTCRKWFSCFCSEISIFLCRQVNHLKQKLSRRRTRTWCGSCWSSCGLAWICLGWCCPPSSWSHAHSWTSSLITITMLTCFPSKQCKPAWCGHITCLCENVLVWRWLGCACAVRRTQMTHWNSVSFNSGSGCFSVGLLPMKGKESDKFQTKLLLHSTSFPHLPREFSSLLWASHNRSVPPFGVLTYRANSRTVKHFCPQKQHNFVGW